MKLEGHQKRLAIYTGGADRHGHIPLASEIVRYVGCTRGGS